MAYAEFLLFHQHICSHPEQW